MAYCFRFHIHTLNRHFNANGKWFLLNFLRFTYLHAILSKSNKSTRSSHKYTFVCKKRYQNIVALEWGTEAGGSYFPRMILRPAPMFWPAWEAPLLVPACSPMMVCPAASVSSEKLRLHSSAGFGPRNGPANSGCL